MNKLLRISQLKKFLFLLWSLSCVAVFISYPGTISYTQLSIMYKWQDLPLKVMRIEPFLYMWNFTGALIGVFLFSLACVSLGFLLIKLLGILQQNNASEFYDRAVLIGTSFLIGQELLSLLFLTLGGLYKLTPAYVAISLLIGFLIGAWPLARFVSANFAAKNPVSPQTTNGKSDTNILWLSIGILFLCLLYSTSRLSYDSVAFYFSDAKITALTGHIYFFPNDSYVVSSFHTGILYTAIIQIFGDLAARISSWINGLVIILFSLAIAKKLGLPAKARLMLLVLLLTTTAFLDLLGDGKIDLASSAPIMATIYWMVVNEEYKSRGAYLLIGIFAGYAMISRPFNIFLMGLFIGLFYLLHLYLLKKSGRLEYRLILKPVLWISPGVLILAAFHLFANWIILGDPLAPLHNALIVTPSIWQWSIDPDNIWVVRLLYPFAITFINSPQTLGNISPLFLAFLPGIFIKEIREKLDLSKDLIVVLIVTLITLALWIVLFFTVIEIRYVLFLWIILYIPLARVMAETLDHIGTLFRKFMGSALILILVFISVRTVFISVDTYSPIDKQGFYHCYDLVLCNDLESINNLASPGDRVLGLGAYRYYLRPDLLSCSSKGEEYLVLERLSNQDNSAFWEEVHRQGYKFIAYEKNYAVRHLRFGITPSPDNTPDWLHLEPIHGHPGDPTVAYRIQVNDPPFKSAVVCAKTDDGAWEVQSSFSAEK